MHLEDYPVESVTFTGMGAEGASPRAAAEALAASLNEWALSQTGRRLLQLSTIPAPAQAGVGIAAILAHTAGSDLAPELGEQVAAAVEEAIQDLESPTLREPLRRSERER